MNPGVLSGCSTLKSSPNLMKTLLAILLSVGFAAIIAGVVISRQQDALREAQAAESAEREAAVVA